MPLDIVVGAQWGDEGKGRIVDLLADKADIVARYSGGDNAGHTVTVGGQTYKLHLIPSGIVHPHTVGVLGNGLVINPVSLLKEMELVRSHGVEITPERLRISYAAHLITPAHIALDRAQEADRGSMPLGTTLRGIGPAYASKVAREGIRMGAMRDPQSLAELLRQQIERANRVLTGIYNAEPLDADKAVQEYLEYTHHLAPYVCDVSMYLGHALDARKRVLAEGAQGTLLDLDHGTYPYVTSSSPTAPGALTGLGVGVGYVDRVIGVTKAFQTRVGEGPFPTEIHGELGDRLRGTGENPWDEFGTTTGRPRRVGWLDTVLLRYAVRVNGLTELVLTKLDVLTGLHPLQICVAYRDQDGVEYTDLPLGPGDLRPFEPVYETLPGWDRDVRDVRSWDDLPLEACDYIGQIEELAGVSISMVSVGPEREQVVRVD